MFSAERWRGEKGSSTRGRQAAMLLPLASCRPQSPPRPPEAAAAPTDTTPPAWPGVVARLWLGRVAPCRPQPWPRRS
eukprot:scaffold913_cov233-Pinguiococcus_pyrenoidosus.AAC.17